ncbi:hypothetical protein O0L34_g12076 [Tuta absoluta]|nr:hypothetical protein O0L34_g12076 [Tuta absoluta]
MAETYRMKDGYNHKHNSSELSVETSCDTSDPFNMFSDNLSPIPASIVPRKLDFTNVDDEDPMKDASMAPMSLSPPYKRVRALRLFDSPHTPKTLLEKCSTPTHNNTRTRLFPPKLSVTNGIPSGSSHHLHPPSDDDSALGSLLPDDSGLAIRRSVANINPFTPQGQALNKKKRALSKTPTWDASPELPAKRLRESNISRYTVEFVELEVIGRGEFGLVTKCVNKLDGCVYAIKRSIKPVAGSAAERAALTEVYAHAALGKHPHVVRYYSAWAEDDHMVIQNEYCDGGSLQQYVTDNGPLPESELLVLLAHIAHGLAYIHSLQLVHMDVKPGNIFISRSDTPPPGNSSDSEDDEPPQPKHKYKIGDLGHVTCAWAPTVEEGDCRYLPREVLQEDFTHLAKADIFAFGLTLYEAAGGGPLPQNGQDWHDIRDGKLPELTNLSREFNQLLKQMVHPDPSQRPSSRGLRKHSILRRGVASGSDTRRASRAALARELAATNMKNELLTRQLQEASRCIKSLTPNIQINQESAKFRTRSAKRLQPTESTHRSDRRGTKPKGDAQLADILQAVTSPRRIDRRNNSRRTKSLIPKKV